MTARVNLSKQLPASYKALVELDKVVEAAAEEAGLDALLINLVKIRTSQINGCAFCLRMHTRDALEHGETTDRLAVVAAWGESQYFTAEEEAALALAEGIARMEAAPLTDQRYAEIAEVLDERRIAAISWVAITINAWNRVAVNSHYPVHA